MKKVLVTGAAGRLGRAVCRVAVPRYRVVALDRERPEVPDGGEAIAGDVRDVDLLKHAATGTRATLRATVALPAWA